MEEAQLSLELEFNILSFNKQIEACTDKEQIRSLLKELHQRFINQQVLFQHFLSNSWGNYQSQKPGLEDIVSNLIFNANIDNINDIATLKELIKPIYRNYCIESAANREKLKQHWGIDTISTS